MIHLLNLILNNLWEDQHYLLNRLNFPEVFHYNLYLLI